MQTLTRPWLWLVVTAVPLVGLTGWLVHSLASPGPIDYEAVNLLARMGRFDQAQAELARHLASNPADARAHLLMAQFALDRSDHDPALALEHLRQIHPDRPETAALLQFLTGKAHHQQGRYDLAEACWIEALRLHPTVAEAGWALLDLLYTEGRVKEAHTLGLRLHTIEPDPRDKVRYLLELGLIDTDKVAPGFQLERFEPLVHEHPDNLPLSITIGLALIRESRADVGLERLRETLKRHPQAPEAWDALLTGLDDASRPEELAAEFGRLPEALKTEPAFARHAGTVAQAVRKWPEAVAAYRRALEYEPYNGVVLYRLSRALRSAGEGSETEPFDERLKRFQTASKQMRSVIEEAQATPTLGVTPQPELYLRLAALSEDMGRYDTARAWHQLVLRDDPRNPVSLAALERLQ